jgi:lipoate-protein ligase A
VSININDKLPYPVLIKSEQTRVFLRLKHGAIIDSRISTSADPAEAEAQAVRVRETLHGRQLHEMSSQDWKAALQGLLLDDTKGISDSDSVLVGDLTEFISRKLDVGGRL